MEKLNNHFLIAMPGLDDPNFVHSVTYICEHNDNGALGIVINHPLEITLGDVFEQMDINADDCARISDTVFVGGPVQPERGFILHHPASRWESSAPVTDDISITTSRDILMALARNEGPEQVLVALGYAGWGPGQLEQEMANNAWLCGPADPDVIFELPVEQRWQAAAKLLGVDLNLLTTEAGHA